MYTYANKTQENKTKSVANQVANNNSSATSTFQFVDNRQSAIQMRKIQGMVNNSPQGKQAAQLMADNYSSQQQPIQRQENKTGLPDNLKSGVENLSGYSMDDVKVHYNSDKPAQVQAHAYTQGTNIHVAPGQEKHLPHEAWHVVQQMQGRVKATMQAKGVAINDDRALEREADLMGVKAASAKRPDQNWSQQLQIMMANRPGLIAQRNPKDIVHGGAVGNRPIIQRNGVDALKYGAKGLIGGGGVGAGIGAIVGYVVPGVETGLGARVGAVIGGLIGGAVGVGGAVGAVNGSITTHEPRSAYTNEKFNDPIYAGKRQDVASDLDLDNYHTLDNAGKINKLFNKFKVRSFRYSMAAGGFDRYAAGNGDCKTLTNAFITIAKEEFGIDVTLGKHDHRFLTAGGATIDSQATGNCDNAKHWFFTNHYWANYDGVSYDLLFGKTGVNEEAFDDSVTRGKLTTTAGNKTDDNIEYWVTRSKTIVWENIPYAVGPNPNKYKSDNTPTRDALLAAGYQAPKSQ